MLANLKSPFKRTSSLVFTFLLSGSYIGGSTAMEIDTDSDGMPDTWENTYFLDPEVMDDRDDIDGDGWTNFQEYERNTDPTDLNSKPSYFSVGDSIAYFNNGSYVDLSNEAPKLKFAIEAKGFNVLPFTEITAESLSDILSDSYILIIPELEKGSLINSLSEEARLIIIDFVNKGGLLLLAGSSRNAAPLINTLFNYSLSRGGSQFLAQKSGNALGTPFENDADTLLGLNGTYPMLLSSLPDTALSFYNDNSYSSVFFVDIGEGRLGYLAYDWYDKSTLNEGWADAWESAIEYSPSLSDVDGDGLPDSWENLYQLDPENAMDATQDLDGDGLNNLQEYINGTKIDGTDSDEDGLLDGEEFYTYRSHPLLSDSDDDGIPDSDEVNLYGTSPIKADSDNDGIQDAWEIEFELDPLTNDSTNDADADGLTNLQEYELGTNPSLQDSDSDDLKDGDEVNIYYSNPLKVDTDSDGLTDGEEVNNYLTDPINDDTDEDTLPDGWEVNFGLDPLKKSERLDSDGDGWFNYFEYDFGTDPTASNSRPRLNASDSDLDGMGDSWEIDNGFDPFDASDGKQDADGDGLLNMQEHHISLMFQIQVNPHNADTDDDDLNDFKEFVKYRTDPNNVDTDDDEMPDGWEVSNGLDPLVNDADVDSDEDGVSNFEEFNAGTIPNNPYLESIMNGTAQESSDEVVTTHTQANGGGSLSIFLLALLGLVLPMSRRAIK